MCNSPKQVMWIKPIASEVKLNIDGSHCGDPPHVGFGGMLRDDKGSCVGGFSGHLGAQSCCLLSYKVLSMV